MLALGLERFFLLDVRHIHVAVVVGVLEFAKSVIMRRTFHPHVKYADFFERRQVIINNHALAAHDGHFPDFARVKPAALDRGRTLFGKAQAHRGHVFDPGSDMRAAAAVHGLRHFADQGKDDGKIMGRQVPGHIDVFLEKAQVEPAGGDIANFADITLLDDFLDFSDDR